MIDLATCLDILDWFDDPKYDLVCDMLVKHGTREVISGLHELSEYCEKLLDEHLGMESEYPETGLIFQYMLNR